MNRSQNLTALKPSAIWLVMGMTLSAGASHASTFLVRPDGTGDLPTIQAAVDVADHGDEILLADGIFLGAGNRDVSYHGKAIWIRSVSLDPTACIVNCEEAAPGFLLISGEGPESGLEGITVMNGHSDQRGGAVTCCDAYPVIQNCRFIGNSTATSAGGAAIDRGASSEVRLICVDIHGNEGGDCIDCIADQLGQLGAFQEGPLSCGPENADLTIRASYR